MILIAKSLGYISKVSIFVCKLIIMLMNFLELVKARYSARKYAGRSVEIEKIGVYHGVCTLGSLGS